MNSQDTIIRCMVVYSLWIGCWLPPNGYYLRSCAFQPARQRSNHRSSFLVGSKLLSAEGSHEMRSPLELPSTEPLR